MDGAVVNAQQLVIPVAGILSLLVAGLGFFLKHWFGQVNSGISRNIERLEQFKQDLQDELQRNYEKSNERIDHIEEKTNQDIAELRQDMNDFKGDCATMFVQRDDFFRYMNGMETSIKDTNSKVDKILMLMTDRRGGNGTQ